MNMTTGKLITEEKEWETRRYELAKTATNAILTNNELYESLIFEKSAKGKMISSFEKALCIRAIRYADEMIKQLKM